MVLEISWAATTDDYQMMILSLICWHHYQEDQPCLKVTVFRLQLYLKKGCWGKQSSHNTIVFPFNRGNYPQDLGRTVMMGRVGGTADKIGEILNLPRYSIPVTLVHIYKTELPSSTSGAWWLKFLFWCFLTIYNNQFSTPDKIYRSGDLTSKLQPKTKLLSRTKNLKLKRFNL